MGASKVCSHTHILEGVYINHLLSTRQGDGGPLDTIRSRPLEEWKLQRLMYMYELYGYGRVCEERVILVVWYEQRINRDEGLFISGVWLLEHILSLRMITRHRLKNAIASSRPYTGFPPHYGVLLCMFVLDSIVFLPLDQTVAHQQQ